MVNDYLAGLDKLEIGEKLLLLFEETHDVTKPTSSKNLTKVVGKVYSTYIMVSGLTKMAVTLGYWPLIIMFLDPG